MQKLGGKKIQIIHKSGQDVFEPLTIKKSFDLFGLFASPKAAARGTVLAPSPLSNTPSTSPRADLAAVKHWVGMEEKIVQNHREQKKASFKSAFSLPKTPVKQSSPAFETFSTQTTVSLSPSVPKLKDPLLGRGKAFRGKGGSFLTLGWIAAAVLLVLFFQGVLSNREAFQRIQREKDQLKQSYAELKSASANQEAELKWLNGQLREREGDLKSLRESKAEYSRTLEKKYREELMRITVRYETQLDISRETIRTHEAVIGALKAQIQAFEKILEQVRVSAISGGVAGFFRTPSASAGAFTGQGKITSVNGRQGFIVTDLGADRGARSGRGVTVSRDGIRLATGRLDRVYPTMSVVSMRDKNLLSIIQEGDAVLLMS